MRDVLAGVIALALLIIAASLATTLQQYRRRRQRVREEERLRGRTIIAEIPAEDDLVLFSEDDGRFYCAEHSIDKNSIVAVRMLVNDVPIASCVSRHGKPTAPSVPEHGGEAARPLGAPGALGAPGDNEGALLRDRWEVVIETGAGIERVACGAIRERVSQELARAVFEAVKRDIDRRDGAS